MTRTKKQRTQLWEKDPHCENCGTLTILPKDCPGFNPEAKFEVPDNMATIQHIYSRLNPLRHTKTNNIRRHFLWCYKCNKEDCETELANFSKEELHRRSNHRNLKIEVE